MQSTIRLLLIQHVMDSFIVFIEHLSDGQRSARQTALDDKIALASNNQGQAFIVVNPPLPQIPQTSEGFWTSTINGLSGWIRRNLLMPVSYESKKKVNLAVDFALGDRVKEMFHILILAVEHDHDKPCTCADDLLDAITGLADILDKPIWVESFSNQDCALFRSHGFKSLIEVTLGDQNPSRHALPVLIDIMVREPRGR